MTQAYSFHQLDVFTHQALMGNPLAVVHAADDLSPELMARFANWTHLSETCFLLKPCHELADYKVRIFTPTVELAFAGHPTLGSCYAWLAQGGQPKSKDFIVQECGVGLIKIRQNGQQLSFAAPALIKSGPLEDAILSQLAQGLGVALSDITHHQWVDNGPGWCVVMLKTHEAVLAIRPDPQLLKDFKVGVMGPYPSGGDADYEVRAFAIPAGITEDPVTGSLNAGIARWLMREQMVGERYSVSQGKALGRRGQIFIEKVGDDIWVGGEVVSCIVGEVSL